MEWQTPGDEGSIIDRVHDGSFKMGHHLHVIVVFSVVAFNHSHFAIHDHEFGVKGA